MSSDKPLRVYAPPLASLFWGTLTANGNTNANVTSSWKKFPLLLLTVESAARQVVAATYKDSHEHFKFPAE
ncbi:MAG: hypothetical protein KME05_13125 [Gloeocapsa sp. UFS-A4-WI-NPMV-4B04]|jgi:hypothetical protein|nr:hypothetical protein [Gloeocapsa sp. UFS-A4-WI-NPMV-4B04]